MAAKNTKIPKGPLQSQYSVELQAGGQASDRGSQLCVSICVTPLDHFKETSGQQQTSFVATKLGVFAKKSGHLQPKHDFFYSP